GTAVVDRRNVGGRADGKALAGGCAPWDGSSAETVPCLPVPLLPPAARVARPGRGRLRLRPLDRSGRRRPRGGGGRGVLRAGPAARRAESNRLAQRLADFAVLQALPARQQIREHRTGAARSAAVRADVRGGLSVRARLGGLEGADRPDAGGTGPGLRVLR